MAVLGSYLLIGVIMISIIIMMMPIYEKITNVVFRYINKSINKNNSEEKNEKRN